MDTDSVEKWKMEFENERKDQLTKAKELQKETMQRRKYEYFLIDIKIDFSLKYLKILPSKKFDFFQGKKYFCLN